MRRLTLNPIELDESRALKGANGYSTPMIRPAPDIRGLGEFAMGLLVSLGKDLSLSGEIRNDTDKTYMASSWVRAHSIRRVAIVGPHNLPIRLLKRIFAWFDEEGIDVDVFLTSTVSDDFAALFRAEDFMPTALDEMVEGDSELDSEKPTMAFPSVPHEVPCHLFGIACLTKLDADAVAIVQARFHKARTSAQRTFQIGIPTDLQVRCLLAEVLDDCVSQDEMVSALRGVETQALCHGVVLRTSLDQLLRNLGGGSPGTRRQKELFKGLLPYFHPTRSLAAVLADVGFSIPMFEKLVIDDLAEDGRHIMFDGTAVEVWDGAAQTIIRAAVEYHKLSSASRRVFARFTDGKIVAAIRKPLFECGLAVQSPLLARNRPDLNKWDQTTGFKLSYDIRKPNDRHSTTSREDAPFGGFA